MWRMLRSAYLVACLLWMVACDKTDTIRASGVWVGAPGSLESISEYEMLPEEGSEFFAGSTVEVVAVYTCSRSCVRIVDSVCDAEWGDDGRLYVDAFWEYEDTSEKSGALWWRGSTCNLMCLRLTVSCGDIVVPEGDDLRVIVNDAPQASTEVPFSAQILRRRDVR